MAVDTIYREQGWRECAVHKAWIQPVPWRQPEDKCSKRGTIYGCGRPLPDPLTDWSAFGEIMEWAENWAAVQLYRLEWSLGWRAFEGKERRTWYATITHRNTIIANTSDDDFRTAVLAALESAIGGTE